MKQKRIRLFLLGIILCVASLTILIYAGRIHLPWNISPNYKGNLYIKSANIDIPCIYVDSPTTNRLAFYVNQPNCAAMFTILGALEGKEATLIADHNYQGFSRIEQCKIGDTAEFIAKDGIVTLYEVTANFTGYNRDEGLWYEDGSYAISDNYGGIILYTCMENTTHVRIVFLQPI